MLVEHGLLSKTPQMRSIVAMSEASSIIEKALQTIARLWSKTVMRFNSLPAAALSSFTFDRTFELLSNSSYILDAVEQSRQVLNICVQAPPVVLSFYGLTSTLSSLRSQVTAIYDFTSIWEVRANIEAVNHDNNSPLFALRSGHRRTSNTSGLRYSLPSTRTTPTRGFPRLRTCSTSHRMNFSTYLLSSRRPSRLTSP